MDFGVLRGVGRTGSAVMGRIGSHDTIGGAFSRPAGFELSSRSNPTPVENVSSATINRIMCFTEGSLLTRNNHASADEALPTFESSELECGYHQ